MLNLGNMTLKKMFNESIFELLKEKKSFQMEVDNKGEYMSYSDVRFDNPMFISPYPTKLYGGDKVTFIFSRLPLRHGTEFRCYLVYYNDVILQIPYEQIVGHTYRWFITNLIYSYDERYYDKDGNSVYEEDIREMYLKDKEKDPDLKYRQYINYRLKVTKDLVKR